MIDISLNMDDDIKLGNDDIGLSSDEEPHGTAEEDSKEEMSEVLRGFKDRARQENQRMEDATDSEYWFAVCFQTREQKEKFLTIMQWLDFGDKYLDGSLIMEQLGIDPGRIPTIPKPFKFDKKLDDLIME